MVFLAALVMISSPTPTVENTKIENIKVHPDQEYPEDILIVDGRLSQHSPYKGMNSEDGGTLAWMEYDKDKSYQYQKRLSAADKTWEDGDPPADEHILPWELERIGIDPGPWHPWDWLSFPRQNDFR